MFYDLYSDLCKGRGVSLNKAASEMGLSNSTVTKWKKTKATPSGDTLSKVSEYFNVSMDFLLSHSTEKAPATQGERQISEQEIRVAMMGGRGRSRAKQPTIYIAGRAGTYGTGQRKSRGLSAPAFLFYVVDFVRDFAVCSLPPALDDFRRGGVDGARCP